MRLLCSFWLIKSPNSRSSTSPRPLASASAWCFFLRAALSRRLSTSVLVCSRFASFSSSVMLSNLRLDSSRRRAASALDWSLRCCLRSRFISSFICRFKSFFRADLDSVGSLAGSYTAAGSSLAGGSPQSDIFDESSLEVAVVKLKEPGARNPAGICADTLTQSAAGFTRLYFVRARTLFVAAFNTFKGFVLLCSFLFFN
mmetsp:Transcript_47837/g.89063  ORF Transcript_47837/g.89063 Transcript_47837/m.89063 type:complete len:200 (+) Transcript_47837:855-1454(+)